jgi:hypothetical protein
MKMKYRWGVFVVVYVMALFTWFPTPAHADHFATNQITAPQTLVPHADVTLISNAAAVVILANNSNRVSALCRLNPGQTGTNTARVGDATISATIGSLMVVGDTITLAVTTAFYGFSATGATINCLEVIRR